ncbi:VWA domain-containing protein [Devosia beringensis]|uniref:VWA domain-containing protein n=1 Tax=Devosia beringensis TaxID=2657486 RepID=UPI00186B8CA9|nr:VWA domain-containing protein [Devosia beringensis]
MNRLLRTLALGLFALLSLSGAALAEGRMIIVMDGSGSMWGQIDGRAKLEIARDTVADVLSGLSEDRELGLLAYGHRQKGNCDDIELIVPPEKNSSAAVLKAVQSMRFLGKTPLTQAVRQAAEALRYTEEEATVVLVTDGLETCEADPCALGNELEQLGLKFTTHVVGFGLTKEEGAAVACLAENTGGRYIRASSANDLTDALNATVNASTQLEPETTALPTAGLSAPDEAPIGTEVEVGWSVSETADLDTIEVGAAGDSDHTAYVYAKSGNPATIQMPGTPGAYELRYVSQDQTIVARRPISVTEAPVSLSAPEQAIVGQLVPVKWVGPDATYDNVRIRLPGSDSYISYDYVSGNNPVTLTMPDEPGTYELAYMLNDSETIGTRSISVVPKGTAVAPLPASLSAPDQTEADSDVQVGWSGPGAGGDYILLRVPGDDSYISNAYVRDNNPVTLPTPSEPGAYELAYRFADERELVVRPITVVNEVSLDEGIPMYDVTFDVPPEFAGTAVEWSAVPQPGQPIAPEAWAMNESSTGRVSVRFEQGVYDVEGIAQGMVFAATVTVYPGAKNSFIIGPKGDGSYDKQNEPFESEGMGEDTGYFCEQAVPCAHQDVETGLSFLLPAGWYTDFPLFYETAGGVQSELPSVTFFGPANGDEIPTIVLNPHQWVASNGPCVDASMGKLCRFESQSTETLSAFEIIRATLAFSKPEGKAELVPNTDSPLRAGSAEEMVGEMMKKMAGEDPGKQQALDMMGALLGVGKSAGADAQKPVFASAETLKRFNGTAIDLGGLAASDIRTLLVPQTMAD